MTEVSCEVCASSMRGYTPFRCDICHMVGHEVCIGEHQSWEADRHEEEDRKALADFERLSNDTNTNPA